MLSANKVDFKHPQMSNSWNKQRKYFSVQHVEGSTGHTCHKIQISSTLPLELSYTFLYNEMCYFTCKLRKSPSGMQGHMPFIKTTRIDVYRHVKESIPPNVPFKQIRKILHFFREDTNTWLRSADTFAFTNIFH